MSGPDHLTPVALAVAFAVASAPATTASAPATTTPILGPRRSRLPRHRMRMLLT
jgi:hypothetical protein